MEQKTETRPEPKKVLVRKLEKLETTAIVIGDPGCRGDLCG